LAVYPLFASQETASRRGTIEQEETVTSWFDWRMAFAWLMAVGIASMIYFLPVARLVE
jgi:hypothetical protein